MKKGVGGTRDFKTRELGTQARAHITSAVYEPHTLLDDDFKPNLRGLHFATIPKASLHTLMSAAIRLSHSKADRIASNHEHRHTTTIAEHIQMSVPSKQPNTPHGSGVVPHGMFTRRTLHDLKSHEPVHERLQEHKTTLSDP